MIDPKCITPASPRPFEPRKTNRIHTPRSRRLIFKQRQLMIKEPPKIRCIGPSFGVETTQVHPQSVQTGSLPIHQEDGNVMQSVRHFVNHLTIDIRSTGGVSHEHPGPVAGSQSCQQNGFWCDCHIDLQHMNSLTRAGRANGPVLPPVQWLYMNSREFSTAQSRSWAAFGLSLARSIYETALVRSSSLGRRE